MGYGIFNLETAYNSASPNCVEAYVEWSSELTSGSSHKVTMKLFARRIDYTGATNIQYGAPDSYPWTNVYTNSYLVFRYKEYVHICTVETTVNSDDNGVASFSGASFYAGFYSSSYGTRRMSGTIESLTLDKPRKSVSISSVDGITCTSNNYSPAVGDNITLTINITDTVKFSGYNLSVSGATLVSGTTYRVNGNVSVVVTGVVRNYTIHVASENGVNVYVKDTSDRFYSDGAKIPYGTSITVYISVNVGYELLSFTVNGEHYNETDNVNIAVSSDVYITVDVRESGVVRIMDGDGFSKYQVFIYTESGWSRYKPMLFTESGWGVCN